MADFYHASSHRARRETKRTCTMCGGPILPGQRYEKHACMYEGDFYHSCGHELCYDLAREVTWCETEGDNGYYLTFYDVDEPDLVELYQVATRQFAADEEPGLQATLIEIFHSHLGDPKPTYEDLRRIVAEAVAQQDIENTLLLANHNYRGKVPLTRDFTDTENLGEIAKRVVSERQDREILEEIQNERANQADDDDDQD